MDTLQENIIWPCELPSETKEAIVLSAIRVNQFGTSLPSSRQTSGVTYINKGIASISFGSEQTNTMNAGVYGKGSWLGGSIINQSFKLHATIEEIEPVEAIFFPKDRIDQLAEKDTNIYKWLYHSSLDTQQQWLLAQVVSLHDRETRVVFALLQIARYTSQIKGSLTAVNASQKLLSSVTGISRPRLNEVLKMLESSGEVSVSRGSIHLLDIAQLEERLTPVHTTILTQS